MKKIAITGAEGFIGRHLCKLLLDLGHEVFAIGLDKEELSYLACDRFHFFTADYSKYHQLHTFLPQNLDCFYHFAWCGGMAKEAFEDFSLQLSNANHCAVALMEAVKVSCRKFVLASTINTLETQAYFGKETLQPRYTNIYGTAKLAAEMICQTLAFQNKIEFNCGLIAMTYGENNPGKTVPNIVMTNLIKNLESNLVPYDTPYDMIYVRDVAHAFVAIGEKGINQKKYYVGHTELSTFGKLFDQIREIINPNAIINYGSFPDVNAVDYNLIDLKALKNDTGYEVPIDVRESILKTIKWLKNE